MASFVTMQYFPEGVQNKRTMPGSLSVDKLAFLLCMSAFGAFHGFLL